MKVLPWLIGGAVVVGGVGAAVYFGMRQKAPVVPAQPGGVGNAPTQPQPQGGGQPNWTAIAQGAGSLFQGIAPALSGIFGSN